MSPLQLHNTRTRAKQTFVPADPSGQVGLFVCGPTVYGPPAPRPRQEAPELTMGADVVSREDVQPPEAAEEHVLGPRRAADERLGALASGCPARWC